MIRRKIFLVVIILMTLLGLFLYFNNSDTDLREASSSGSNEEKNSASQKNIRLIATGDMLPHETVNERAKSGADYNYRQFFDQTEQFFANSDIRFCNQEAPSAVGLNVTAYPTFNAPPAFAKDLSAVGCNLISLANNHSNDRGQAGIDSTRELWEELKPLAVSGSNRDAAEQNAVSYFEVKGVKFAFVAYSEISNSRFVTSYGLNILDERLVQSHLKTANDSADVVIVSAHWGTEYSSATNSNQEKWARIFAEYGADVVLGTGPHVLQPVKKIPSPSGEETIVFYSLGNFLSTQLDTESLIGGLGILDINPETKKIEKISFLPTYMHYEWTPEQKSREDLLSRKNLKIYPLDQASEPLSRSQNNTTVQSQTSRITKLLNQFTKVDVIQSSQF